MPAPQTELSRKLRMAAGPGTTHLIIAANRVDDAAEAFIERFTADALKVLNAEWAHGQRLLAEIEVGVQPGPGVA